MILTMLLLLVQTEEPGSPPQDAALVAPVTNPGGWVTSDDYPLAALRDGQEGVTGFRLTIGPDGLPRRCEVTASSGRADLDDATCRLLMERARFKTHRDDKGVRIGGTYSSRVRWQIPDDYLERLAQSGFRVDETRGGLPRGPIPDPAMVTLDSADHYPAAAVAARLEGDVRMMLDVDVAGKVTNCVVTETSLVKSLDVAACALMRSNGQFQPALDSAGKPVKSVVPAVFSWMLPRSVEAEAAAEPPRRKFPLFEPATTTMTIVIGADGVASDCKFSSTGNVANLFPDKNPCDIFGGKVRYVPFVDASGQPVARRVTMRNALTIDDAETPKGTASK